MNKPQGYYEVGPTGGRDVANVVLKQTGLENRFLLKKTFFNSKVFKRILRFSVYYVLRYEVTTGQGFPSARKMPATIPTWVGILLLYRLTARQADSTTVVYTMRSSGSMLLTTYARRGLESSV